MGTPQTIQPNELAVFTTVAAAGHLLDLLLGKFHQGLGLYPCHLLVYQYFLNF